MRLLVRFQGSWERGVASIGWRLLPVATLILIFPDRFLRDPTAVVRALGAMSAAGLLVLPQRHAGLRSDQYLTGEPDQVAASCVSGRREGP